MRFLSLINSNLSTKYCIQNIKFERFFIFNKLPKDPREIESVYN